MPLKRFNNTSWAAVVTQTDRPNSVCNRCVIEGFSGVFVLSRCFIGLSVGVGAFVIGLSLISSFFSCRCYSDKVLKQLFVYVRSRKKLQTESGNNINFHIRKVQINWCGCLQGVWTWGTFTNEKSNKIVCKQWLSCINQLWIYWCCHILVSLCSGNKIRGSSNK